MKAALSILYSIFVMALTTVSVISVLYLTVTSVASLTDVEWLAVSGVIIVFYLIGITVSFAGLYAIEKLFERDRKKA